MPARTKSITQSTGAFVYTNGAFTEVYPHESHGQVPANATLNNFCNDIGTPEKLKSGRAYELCGQNSVFLKNAKDKCIDMSYAELERKNRAEESTLESRPRDQGAEEMLAQ